MNILDIARGMLFGYGVKIVQIAATLLVVPFILSVLGIERYGHIFAILSALGILTLVSDGLKLSFARSISQSINGGPEATSQCVGAGLKAMLLLASIVGLTAFLFRTPLLEMLGVPLRGEYLNSVLLAAGIVSVENGLFSFHAYLTARGRLDFLNALTAAEVLIRNGSFVLVFLHQPARADTYFAIFFLWSTLRYLIMASYAISTWREDFRGLSRGRIQDAWGAVSYSLPLTFDSLQHYLFQRFSIPLVNRFIGPAEAGLLALGINSISNNLAQVLFTVARPLLVPVAARLDLANMTPPNRHLLLRVDAMFALCVALTMIPLIVLMPAVIGVWLGEEYRELVLPAQILVSGTALNVSFNIRRSLLIGQGYGGAIVRTSFILTLLAALAFAWALFEARSWVYITAVIASFSALTSVLAVGIVFERHLLRPESVSTRGTLRRTIAWVLAISIAILMGRYTPDHLTWNLLVLALASAGSVLLIAHLLVVPVQEVVATLQKLRKGARRSLFVEPS